MVGVYIHIAYCRTICPYCDFVRDSERGPVPDAYIDALGREMDAFDGPAEAHSVFFGGGTPSLLAPAALERILDALQRRFRLEDPEITIEANPDDITPEVVSAWRACGVNRVSLGVQSFDDAALRYLGRRHDAATARRACETVAAVFRNWSMDLIYGVRPPESWEPTLQRCLERDPPHISAYGLTYEPGTPFGKRAHEAVSEEESLAMYRQTEHALSGYDHYEISNFAKPGHASRHNLVYWRNGEYAGFGAGAYSFIGGKRTRNATNIADYIKNPGEKIEALDLTEHEIRVETLIQYFRLKSGLPKAEYERRFGRAVNTDYGAQIELLKQHGLLKEDQHMIRPTTQGFYLNNEIGLALV